MDFYFNLEEFPYDTLQEFGITPEMIYDLPQPVIDLIRTGGYSPILPIVLVLESGTIRSRARFRIVESLGDKELDVMFLWQRIQTSTSELDNFSDQEKSLLLEGRAIKTSMNIDVEVSENNYETRQMSVYAQYDKETRQIIAVPTQIIGRNARAISNEFRLEPSDLGLLLDGSLVSIKENNETITMGINLLSDSGVFITKSDALVWKITSNQIFPEFYFGVHGCWVNHNGVLDYVFEDDFTPEILAAKQAKIDQEKIRQSATKTEQSEESKQRITNSHQLSI